MASVHIKMVSITHTRKKTKSNGKSKGTKVRRTKSRKR